MRVTITNLYNDVVPQDSEFIANHGQSFLIEFDEKKVLYDAGMNGEKLLHNMKLLKIDPNSIDVLVLSHGHLDHTGGLKALLEKRTAKEPLEIIGHPAVFEPKGMHDAKKVPEEIIEFYLPPIEGELRKKMSLNLTTKPIAINPYLSTVGEVNQRPHKDGVEKRTRHYVNGNWEHDKLLDDLSLVLKTNDGLVLICGCCHAGLLNTLEQVTRNHMENIIAIIGGTHMFLFSEEEVDFVAGQIMNKYSSPKLYFNHCSGQNTIDCLRSQIKSDIIKSCLVGTKLSYDC
ncbi:MAG: MBL fold metallo-hydrolase [Candidatus Heimdallarchaeota archaeon]|nr:MBL fold metallo-hydrolase [Candidatus Heimdallarchaeota archaeon]MCG3253174.1 MBL fold metallo-hydrolase [Candidatus Heimdallarchaeota archaeon]MCK4290311.1 MBL fold metallo-hydrolase [Candidatus Heimdallarchaeota archaeon]